MIVTLLYIQPIPTRSIPELPAILCCLLTLFTQMVTILLFLTAPEFLHHVFIVLC